MKQNKVPNYSKWIKRLRTVRITAAVICSLIICGLIFVSYMVWTSSDLIFQDSILMLLAFFIIVFGGLLAKNIRESVSVFVIAREGNYACMLSNRQIAEIGDQQGRRNHVFYLAAFSVIVITELLFLTVIYAVKGGPVYLIMAGLMFLFGIILVLAFSLYHSARLGVRNTFCTLSGNGILVSGDVIPMNPGDVISVLKFTDYYLIRFYKYEIFKIKHKSEIIIPTDGVVRDGVNRPADEEIVDALGLTGLFATDSPWFESRDYGEKDSLSESEAAESV